MTMPGDISSKVLIKTNFKDLVHVEIVNEHGTSSIQNNESNRRILKDKSSGYVLVFREMTPRQEMVFNLGQLAAGRYSFELIAGDGNNFKTTIKSDHHVKLKLAK